MNPTTVPFQGRSPKQRREAGEKGPTHNIFQHWQKLRNSELHPKGDWKIVATEIGPIQ